MAISRICIKCGDSFTTVPSNGKKYCSRTCLIAWVRVNKTPQRKRCIGCSGLYSYGRIEGVVNHRGLYCSDACKFKTIEKRKQTRSKCIKCRFCRKPLIISKKDTRKFCNRECFIEWFRQIGFRRLVLRLQKRTFPNTCESMLLGILKLYGFKYVGNGSLFIGRCNPDFIHKKLPLVVELFGEPWHPFEDISKKRYHYGKYGYKCMIVWVKQLRSLERVKNRVKSFIAKSA